MDEAQHNGRMLKLLDDRLLYKPMRENPGPSISKKKVRTYVEKLVKFKFLPNSQCNYLSNPYFRDPRIRGIAKTHKPDVPLRPIIDGRSGPVYFLSKFFSMILDKFRPANNKYDVNNSMDVKCLCKKLPTLEPELVMVSFDAAPFCSQILLPN